MFRLVSFSFVFRFAFRFAFRFVSFRFAFVPAASLLPTLYDASIADNAALLGSPIAARLHVSYLSQYTHADTCRHPHMQTPTHADTHALPQLTRTHTYTDSYTHGHRYTHTETHTLPQLPRLNTSHCTLNR